jgi:hypothetical protein
MSIQISSLKKSDLNEGAKKAIREAHFEHMLAAHQHGGRINDRATPLGGPEFLHHHNQKKAHLAAAGELEQLMDPAEFHRSGGNAQNEAQRAQFGETLNQPHPTNYYKVALPLGGNRPLDQHVKPNGKCAHCEEKIAQAAFAPAMDQIIYPQEAAIANTGGEHLYAQTGFNPNIKPITKGEAKFYLQQIVSLSKGQFDESPLDVQGRFVHPSPRIAFDDLIQQLTYHHSDARAGHKDAYLEGKYLSSDGERELDHDQQQMKHVEGHKNHTAALKNLNPGIHLGEFAPMHSLQHGDEHELDSYIDPATKSCAHCNKHVNDFALKHNMAHPGEMELHRVMSPGESWTQEIYARFVNKDHPNRPDQAAKAKASVTPSNDPMAVYHAEKAKLGKSEAAYYVETLSKSLSAIKTMPDVQPLRKEMPNYATAPTFNSGLQYMVPAMYGAYKLHQIRQAHEKQKAAAQAERDQAKRDAQHISAFKEDRTRTQRGEAKMDLAHRQAHVEDLRRQKQHQRNVERGSVKFSRIQEAHQKQKAKAEAKSGLIPGASPFDIPQGKPSPIPKSKERFEDKVATAYAAAKGAREPGVGERVPKVGKPLGGFWESPAPQPKKRQVYDPSEAKTDPGLPLSDPANVQGRQQAYDKMRSGKMSKSEAGFHLQQIVALVKGDVFGRNAASRLQYNQPTDDPDQNDVWDQQAHPEYGGASQQPAEFEPAEPIRNERYTDQDGEYIAMPPHPNNVETELNDAPRNSYDFEPGSIIKQRQYRMQQQMLRRQEGKRFSLSPTRAPRDPQEEFEKLMSILGAQHDNGSDFHARQERDPIGAKEDHHNDYLQRHNLAMSQLPSPDMEVESGHLYRGIKDNAPNGDSHPLDRHVDARGNCAHCDYLTNQYAVENGLASPGEMELHKLMSPDKPWTQEIHDRVNNPDHPSIPANEQAAAQQFNAQPATDPMSVYKDAKAKLGKAEATYYMEALSKIFKVK